MITVGERLIASRHYALDVMQVGNKKLRTNWEKFSMIVEDRNNMFELSVVFHDWQQKVVYVYIHSSFFTYLLYVHVYGMLVQGCACNLRAFDCGNSTCVGG